MTLTAAPGMVAATGPGIRPLTFRLTSPPTAATLSANALEPSSVAAAGREIEIVALRLPEGNLRRHLGDARAALARSDRDVGALDEEVNRLAHDLEDVQRSPQRQTVLRSGERQE